MLVDCVPKIGFSRSLIKNIICCLRLCVHANSIIMNFGTRFQVTVLSQFHLLTNCWKIRNYIAATHFSLVMTTRFLLWDIVGISVVTVGLALCEILTSVLKSGSRWQGDMDVGNTLQLKLNCKNCCPYVKLLKQSLHSGKVVMCMWSMTAFSAVSVVVSKRP